jgi:hypothetical protein
MMLSAEVLGCITWRRGQNNAVKAVYPSLFLSIGIISVFLFHADVFLPIWASVTILLIISIFLWSGYQHNRVGVLMLLLWLVYALPFIHVAPYLWFDFANEDPPVLWGLMVNPYMLNETIIQLTAMIGAVGGIGFALGVSLNNKAIVRDTGINRRLVRTLSNPIWMFWVIVGIALSWLSAPDSTLFTAAYTESKSALDDANFSSAWMISYVLLAFALCDAILDQNPARMAFKRMVVFIAIAFVVVFLQLLRGDRESIPFVFGVLFVYFYWAAPLTQKYQIQIPWKKIFCGGFVLFVISILVGGTRHSLVEIPDIGTLVGLLYDLYGSEVFNVSNLLHGTWSAVLLTPLSVAGDHVYKLLPLKFGEDYLNLFLSLPPGFVADAVGFKRPIDALAGPAWEMRYGLGGTHAAVVPFMNFRMLGVLVIPALWAYIFTHVEKGALKRLNVANLTLLCTVAMAAPHWLWYGEKNVLNALIIWLLLAGLYRISLANSCISTPVSKIDLRFNLRSKFEN